MSDKDEAVFMHAVEKYGTLRDKEIIPFVFNRGLHSMEVYVVIFQQKIL